MNIKILTPTDLQQLLMKHGYALPQYGADGYWGDESAAACAAWFDDGTDLASKPSARPPPIEPLPPEQIGELVLSDKGSQVLIDREGCELTAYYDSVGVLTIGVGHTSAAGPPSVSPGMTISQAEADEIFARDNDTFEQVVRDAITEPMQQHEYDAFVSICFNIGGGGFSGATFVKSFNIGNSKEQVANEILWWDEPAEIIPRRKGEAHQFLTGEYIARID